MKKVLILTGSYGAGHNAAAKALKQYYEKNNFNAKVVDITEFIDEFLAKTTKTFYKISSEEYPVIWEAFYNLTDSKLISRLVYAINLPFIQAKFNRLINSFNPDIIISVFPFWAWLVKNYIKNFNKNFKWGIVITDAINIQSFWYVRPKYVDKYFVIDDFSKKIFVEKFNYPREKVIVSFFPLSEEIYCNRIQVGNDKILMLLTGIDEEFITLFLEKTSANITILKGRAEDLYFHLQKKYGSKFTFLDFLNISENLKNFDIFIGKPGGAITSECIATDTFIFVPNFFPGQEEGNMKLLEYFECGLYEKSPDKVEFFRKYFNFNKFLPNYKKLKKPACKIIFDNLK